MVLRITQRVVSEEGLNLKRGDELKKNALYIDAKGHKVKESQGKRLRCIFKGLYSELHEVAYKTQKPFFGSYLRIHNSVYISLNSLAKRFCLTPQQLTELKNIKPDLGETLFQARIRCIEGFIAQNGLKERDQAYRALAAFIQCDTDSQNKTPNQIHALCLKKLASTKEASYMLNRIISDPDDALPEILNDKQATIDSLLGLLFEMGAELSPETFLARLARLPWGSLEDVKERESLARSIPASWSAPDRKRCLEFLLVMQRLTKVPFRDLPQGTIDRSGNPASLQSLLSNQENLKYVLSQTELPITLAKETTERKDAIYRFFSSFGIDEGDLKRISLAIRQEILDVRAAED